MIDITTERRIQQLEKQVKVLKHQLTQALQTIEHMKTDQFNTSQAVNDLRRLFVPKSRD